MQAFEFINANLPFLKDTDDVQFALDVMAGNAVTRLPLVRSRRYSGMIAEDTLLNLENTSTTLRSVTADNSSVFVDEHEHVFELIRKMIETNEFMMPVVASDRTYLGVADAESIIRKLGTNSSIMEPGGLIVLEMNKSDYSLNEISRIVESNDALILNCFISSHRELSQIEVTIKINKKDLQDIIATFERYEYKIKASFHQSSHQENLQERYESLMHYLKM